MLKENLYSGLKDILADGIFSKRYESDAFSVFCFAKKYYIGFAHDDALQINPIGVPLTEFEAETIICFESVSALKMLEISGRAVVFTAETLASLKTFWGRRKLKKLFSKKCISAIARKTENLHVAEDLLPVTEEARDALGQRIVSANYDERKDIGARLSNLQRRIRVFAAIAAGCAIIGIILLSVSVNLPSVEKVPEAFDKHSAEGIYAYTECDFFAPLYLSLPSGDADVNRTSRDYYVFGNTKTGAYGVAESVNYGLDIELDLPNSITAPYSENILVLDECVKLYGYTTSMPSGLTAKEMSEPYTLELPGNTIVLPDGSVFEIPATEVLNAPKVPGYGAQYEKYAEEATAALKEYGFLNGTDIEPGNVCLNASIEPEMIDNGYRGTLSTVAGLLFVPVFALLLYVVFAAGQKEMWLAETLRTMDSKQHLQDILNKIYDVAEQQYDL